MGIERDVSRKHRVESIDNQTQIECRFDSYGATKKITYFLNIVKKCTWLIC